MNETVLYKTDGNNRDEKVRHKEGTRSWEYSTQILSSGSDVTSDDILIPISSNSSIGVDVLLSSNSGSWAMEFTKSQIDSIINSTAVWFDSGRKYMIDNFSGKITNISAIRFTLSGSGILSINIIVR